MRRLRGDLPEARYHSLKLTARTELRQPLACRGEGLELLRRFASRASKCACFRSRAAVASSVSWPTCSQGRMPSASEYRRKQGTGKVGGSPVTARRLPPIFALVFRAASLRYRISCESYSQTMALLLFGGSHSQWCALGRPYIIGNTCPELRSLQDATQNAQLCVEDGMGRVDERGHEYTHNSGSYSIRRSPHVNG